MSTARDFLSALPFEADPFQIDAADALDRGETVVVTAPTGAGKTVVAEAAIHRSLAAGRRSVYTTPLKALSNQKFGDLRRALGEDQVGLLTGDNSINGGAPTVVMTTEVLRNMMYASSPDLDDVGVVILDEVHYLQDRSRGAVWEEIIVHLDTRIPLVCLSATVANAPDFADWVRDRRGATTLVVERERPVPLESLYMLRDRWDGSHLRLLSVFHGSRPNERVGRMLRSGRDRRRRYVSPRRHEACEMMRREGLLPAIYFIFSRKGCDAAADTVVERGLRLTSRTEADEITETAEAATAHLSPKDLSVLGYDRWAHNLAAGVAAHHAGMVPPMKEAVERLFARGLVRLVFATETLALGINMPARSVVLEGLTKFTGEGHELMQAGDYTQLTGRAGRRGIDEAGTAVVLHSPYVAFDQVAGIAGRGSHPLRSSFRPTYNMAVNLIARYPQDQAETLINASFAAFADERRRGDMLRRIEEDERRLESLRTRAEHPEIDVWKLIDGSGDGLRRRLMEFVGASQTGDVLEWREGGRRLRFVVVARGSGKRPRLMTVSERGAVRRIAADRIPEDVARLGRIDLDIPIRPGNSQYRKRAGESLSAWEPTGTPQTIAGDGELPPGLSSHLDAARDARRLERRLEGRRRRAATLGPGLVSRLRSVQALLEEWGYADGWALTQRGVRLRTIYNELDLLLAEAMHRGLFADLTPAETGSLASAFVFEPRASDPGDDWPGLRLGERGASVTDLHSTLTRSERRLGLPTTREPDGGFSGRADAWISGAELVDLFGEEHSGIGDFVRVCRQTVDLLRQMRDTAAELAPEAGAAAALMDRGVVADSVAS